MNKLCGRNRPTATFLSYTYEAVHIGDHGSKATVLAIYEWARRVIVHVILRAQAMSVCVREVVRCFRTGCEATMHIF